MRTKYFRFSCVLCAAVVSAFFVSAVQAEVGDQLRVLTANDDDAGGFGNAVAFDEKTVIAGAHYCDNPSYNSGAAYLFDLDTGNQLYQLTPSDPRESAYFGRQVDISKNNAVIGAPWKKFNLGEVVKQNVGEAYIFNASSGGQLYRLYPDDPTVEYQYFGSSVGISGNTAIVGSDGSAYLFDVSKGTKIRKYTGLPSSEFGSAVAIDRNIAIVGAYGEDSWSGSAYLFDLKSGEMLHRLTPTGVTKNAMFGSSVAICGNIAVVGAAFENNDTGAAYVFNATSGELIAKFNGTSVDDCFGVSVAVSGNVVAVGAESADHYSGAAYLYNATTGLRICELSPSDETDMFGAGVAISGTKALVAAQYSYDSENGAIYMFEAPDPKTLDMPEMPTENYKQFEPGWRDDVYGRHTAGDGFTMRGYGCGVTSLSMALDYAGVTDQDPGTLNSLMAYYGGFAGKGSVLWGAATLAAANLAHVPNVYFKDDVRTGTAALDELLATGNPVVVRVVSKMVYNSKTGKMEPKYHFVLVTGKQKGQNGEPDVYWIQDPGSSANHTLDCYLANGEIETRGYVCDPDDVSTLDIAVSCDLSGEDAGSGINIRVTDPWGKVTYYDEEGNAIEDIPGSAICFDSYGDYFSDEPDTEICQQVMISQPGVGDYQVLVSCLGGTLPPYSLTISAFNEDGSLQFLQEYTGSLGTNGSEMYSFTYTPEPSTLVLFGVMAVAIRSRRRRTAC